MIREKKRAYLISFVLMTFLLALNPPSMAEYDKTKKMKAEAEHYFEARDYYKAIGIWAEVLKIDSYDKEALEGIHKAQKLLEESQGEKGKSERQRLRELIQEGKNYYRDREYKKALSSWGQALAIDPTEKEVLDLIEDAKIRAQYQISILDKLDREKRLKTPHIRDLDRIAKRMTRLLEKTDRKVRKEKAKEAEEEIKKETLTRKAEEESEIAAKIAELEEGIAAFEEREKIEEELKKKEGIERSLREEDEKKKFEKELRQRERLEEEKRQKELEQRETEELKERERLEREAKRKAGLERLKEGIREKEAGAGKWVLRRQGLLIIGIIVSLVLFLMIRITTRTKIKPFGAKAPPKGVKKGEEFEPRDLKKFLKDKNEDKDKDLFK